MFLLFDFRVADSPSVCFPFGFAGGMWDSLDINT